MCNSKILRSTVFCNILLRFAVLDLTAVLIKMYCQAPVTYITTWLLTGTDRHCNLQWTPTVIKLTTLSYILLINTWQDYIYEFLFCVVKWHLVSVRTLGVMYSHALLHTSNSSDLYEYTICRDDSWQFQAPSTDWYHHWELYWNFLYYNILDVMQ